MSNLTSDLTAELANTTTDAARLAALYASTKFTIHSILTPLVVAVGVLGNLVSVIVLTRRRMRSSTNWYLTALAVSDSLYLLLTLTLSLRHSVPGLQQVRHRSYWHYWRYAIWLVDAASNTSTWLTVTFTVERYIAVCHPIRGQVYCTISRARRVIVAVYLLCFLVTIPTPFEWVVEEHVDVQTNTTRMGINFSELGNRDAYRHGYYWFTACTFIFAPLLLLAIFNAFLIAAVKRSRRQRAALCAGESQSQSQENKITVMLIAVVLIYMLCQLPHACMLLHHATAGEAPPHSATFYTYRIINNVFNFLMAINAACNFVLYCALSDKYRKTFLATFCWCWCAPRGAAAYLPTASTNVSEFSRVGSPRSAAASFRSSFRSGLLSSQKSLRHNGGGRALLHVPEQGEAAAPAGVQSPSGAAEGRRLLETAAGVAAEPPPPGRRSRLPRWLRAQRRHKHSIVVTTPDGSREQGTTAL